MRQKLNNEQIFTEKVASGKIESSQLASEYAKIISDKEKSYYHILRKKLIPVGNNAEYRCFIQKFHKEVYENVLDVEGNIVNKGMVENLKASIHTDGDIIELWNPNRNANTGIEIDMSTVETVEPIGMSTVEPIEFPEPKIKRK